MDTTRKLYNCIYCLLAEKCKQTKSREISHCENTCIISILTRFSTYQFNKTYIRTRFNAYMNTNLV